MQRQHGLTNPNDALDKNYLSNIPNLKLKNTWLKSGGLLASSLEWVGEATIVGQSRFSLRNSTK